MDIEGGFSAVLYALRKLPEEAKHSFGQIREVDASKSMAPTLFSVATECSIVVRRT